jgi:hypothetical protein
MAHTTSVIPIEKIQDCILVIRGRKVILSFHLAEMYGVETGALVRAVKRNRDRFPEDFMFQLADMEWKNLKCQIGISSWGGIRRALPYAFTEEGVAMLSSVLNSPRAVQVNIEIMRAFVRLRGTESSTVSRFWLMANGGGQRRGYSVRSDPAADGASQAWFKAPVGIYR